MAEWTKDQIAGYAKGVMELFDDGFQTSDLFKVVPAVMEIIGAVKDTTGPEKMALAILLVNYVIDETDTPWVPDAIADPIMKKYVPGAIQMAWDAAEGKFNFKGDSD